MNLAGVIGTYELRDILRTVSSVTGLSVEQIISDCNKGYTNIQNIKQISLKEDLRCDPTRNLNDLSRKYSCTATYIRSQIRLLNNEEKPKYGVENKYYYNLMVNKTGYTKEEINNHIILGYTNESLLDKYGVALYIQYNEPLDKETLENISLKSGYKKSTISKYRYNNPKYFL